MAEGNVHHGTGLDRQNYEDDWRSSCGSLVQQWGEARKRKLYTDVEFLVGDGKSAVSFSAHKNVLAFGSPVFEAMFYGQLAEKKSPIRITDIEPESFEILLRYVYGETIIFVSVLSAANTYFAADKYLVDRLKTEVEIYIPLSAVTDSQFWEMILQEKFFRIKVIRSRCLVYISKHAATLLKCELLLNVSLDVMKAILQLEYLNASEYELLLAVGRWYRGHFSSVLLQNIATQNALESLLPYIRFSNLTTDEFSSFDESHHGVIGSDDSLAILKHLCNPSKYKLPDWCSVSTKKRNAAFSTTNKSVDYEQNPRSKHFRNSCIVKRTYATGCAILR